MICPNLSICVLGMEGMILVALFLPVHLLVLT